MCVKNQQNELNAIYVFVLRYFHLHVLAGNTAIFSVTFLVQKYVVIKCVKLLHSIEIHMTVSIFYRMIV
jgi:hypothetical protein